MTKPPRMHEVFLQPGELHFGNRHTRIRTLLGSCVSLVLWHPRALLGGMCHFMLPTRLHAGPCLDGRYADEALALLLREIHARHTLARDYQVQVFGGGNMFAGRPHNDIGGKNIEAAQRLIRQHDLRCIAHHVGGSGYRNLIFDVWSGQVALRQPSPQQIARHCYEARTP